MLKFTAYIEYLLMTRHYCYVPGHGAYMLADEPEQSASLPTIGANSSKSYSLKAPRRRVLFSPLHTHDDGILANLLMEAEGMSYDEACRYIDRQKSQLDDSITNEAFHSTDTENFGFEDLNLESWMDLESRLHPAAQPTVAAKTEDKQSDNITIPRIWLQRAAMILLVIVFFFTNFIGIHNGNAQLASVIDATLLQRNAMVHQTWDEEDELCDYVPDADLSDEADTQDATSTDLLAEAKDADIQDEASATEPDIVSLHTDILPTPSIPQGKRYYIIIASVVSEEDALAVCQRYAKQGFDSLGILAKQNLYRVYSASFSDKDEAVTYLRQLRQSNPRLEKSWMLPLDDESLSYIIKNIYNDNQLSMELSHPNPRTERDQG